MRAKGGFPVWVVVMPAAVMFAVVALLALLGEEDRADADPGVSFSEVAEEPQRFYGETVTVNGWVEVVLGPRSLLIGERFTAGEVVVIADAPLQETLDEAAGGPADVAFLETSGIWVTGEVRRLDLSSAERRIGADLDENALDAYAGTTAIIADSVAFEPPESAGRDGMPRTSDGEGQPAG